MITSWFHVMNRAAASRRLLRQASEGHALVKLIETHCADGGLEVHAYCLLDLHYHLLVRGSEASLHTRVAGLEEAWSAVPLFTAKPRVLRVTPGHHVSVVSRYIHLNPVTAGLVWRPEDWPYSSYRAYLGDHHAPCWVRTAAVLGPFGSGGARHRYRAFVRAGLDPGARDASGRPRWGTVFARGSLDEELAWRIEPILEWRSDPPSAAGSVPLSVLARVLGDAFAVRPEAVRSWREGGGARAALARGAFVHAARSLGCYRLREVAAWMRYASPTAAVLSATRFEQAARADPALAEMLDGALRRLEPRGPTEPARS